MKAIFLRVAQVGFFGVTPSFLVGFLVVHSLVYSQRGDYGAHIYASMNLSGSEYSFVFLLIRVGSVFVSPEFAMTLLASFLFGLSGGVVYILARLSAMGITFSFVASLASSLVMPLPILSALASPGLSGTRIYLGQLSPNQYHNVTTLASVPFAIVATWLVITQIDRLTGRLGASGSLFLSTLAKPNFLLAFAPALVLDGLLRRRTFSDPIRALKGISIVLIPSLLLIGLQYVAAQAGGVFADGRSVLVVDFLAQWSAFTDSIPISVARSVVFPVLVLALILSVRDWTALRLLKLPWVILSVAVAQFALMSEVDGAGQAIIHGNWAWQVIVSAKILFVFSTIELGKFGKSHSRLNPLGKSLMILAAFALALHVVSGGIYIFHIVSGGSPFT